MYYQQVHTESSSIPLQSRLLSEYSECLTTKPFSAFACIVNVACNTVTCKYNFVSSVSLFGYAGLIELISAKFVELFGCLISASTENVLSNNPLTVSSIIISEIF